MLLMYTVQVRVLIAVVLGLGRGLGFFHRSVGFSVGKEFCYFLDCVLYT